MLEGAKGYGQHFRVEQPLSSVEIRARVVSCGERETLVQAYLDATEAHRKAADSVDELHSPEWSKATEETRQACEEALAALKAHIREHGCLPLKSVTIAAEEVPAFPRSRWSGWFWDFKS